MPTKEQLLTLFFFGHPLLPRAVGRFGLSPSAGPGGDGNPSNLVYPAGMVFVRCGWVAEAQSVELGLQDATVATIDGAMAYENPLADLSAAEDVEAGRSLMPPLPHLTIDRILRRAAERIGVGKVRSNRISPSRAFGE